MNHVITWMNLMLVAFTAIHILLELIFISTRLTSKKSVFQNNCLLPYASPREKKPPRSLRVQACRPQPLILLKITGNICVVPNSSAGTSIFLFFRLISAESLEKCGIMERHPENFYGFAITINLDNGNSFPSLF